VALPPGGRALSVFDTASSQRTEACYACLDPDPGGACADDFVRPAAGDLQVASGLSGTRVIGARVNAGSGLLELVERELTPCHSDWRLLGTADGSDGAQQFQPVMFGLRPGLVYLKSGALYVYHR
jgi:hypothetical protein